MAYTPELNRNYCCTLRRIAWHQGIPMTRAIRIVFDAFVAGLDPSSVCLACKDKSKCSWCHFHRK